VFKRSTADRIKENVISASELARQLAQDEKFRKRLISAVEHGSEARRRARGALGVRGRIRGLASDEQLLAELKAARADLQRAYKRGEAKTRTKRLRKLFVVGAVASIASSPRLRERAMAILGRAMDHRRPVIDFGNRNRSPRSLEDLTKEELYARAQEADIPGRSEMSKEELISALRASDRASA
jgi:hypothetical protein